MKDRHYTALIDADTILYASCAAIQTNEIEVKHTNSNRVKMFKNITAFREFLKTKEQFNEDDFTWEVKPELSSEVSHAMHTIKLKIEAIENLPWCKDIRIFIGGEGNFRKDIYPDYKGNRGAKPLAFKECKDYMIKKWKDKVVIVDGVEAEDVVGWEAHKGYLKALSSKNKDDTECVICHVDKDVDMICGWHFNYNKPEEGVKWVDNRTAFRSLCYQLLIGDRGTDNIKGVDIVTKEMKEKYLIKTNSIGSASATKILEDLKTERQMLEKIVEVYKMAYGDKWLNQLDFTGKLVWIMRFEHSPFDAKALLQEFGVQYD